MSDVEKAIALITSISNAIEAGTRHYALDGTELRTTRDVLLALKNDGEIQVAPREEFSHVIH